MEVIILGTGRSGTSIFNRIIGLHDDIWSFQHESQIFSGLPALVDLIDHKNPRLLVSKFTDRCSGHLFKRDVGGRYSAGLFEIIEKNEFDRILSELKDGILLAKSEQQKIAVCRAFADQVFAKTAEREGKTTWAEKTPRNLLYADKIQKLYPSARFINLVRDGREVVSSIKERNFWPVAKSTRFDSTKKFGGEINLQKAAYYWKTLMEITNEMRDRVGQDNWLDIRLEDLGSDLPNVQERVEKFVGVAHDSQFAEKCERILRKGDTDKKRWMRGKTDAEIKFLNKELEHYLVEYGYEV